MQNSEFFANIKEDKMRFMINLGILKNLNGNPKN